MRKLAIVSALYVCSTGCFTPNKERQLNSDIYSLQQRTFELEKKLSDKSSTQQTSSDTTKKSIASTTMTVEKLEIEIQRLKGELDALKVGIRTGQVPGEEVEEGTLIYTINDILTRMESVEESQAEILAAIRGDKKDKKDKKDSDSASKSTAINTVDELSSAFDKKLYPKVISEAPDLLKKVNKKSSKETIMFLYAESLYKLGKLRDAALKFNDFIDAKPSKEKIAHAKLRMGDCFRHLGDNATSKVYYSELIEEFPGTEQAETAAKRLDKLKKKS